MPRGRVKLRTSCYNQNDELILDGAAIVIPPRTHIIEQTLKQISEGL
jgi:3-hydroxybutyryl-CoA dehydratase